MHYGNAIVNANGLRALQKLNHLELDLNLYQISFMSTSIIITLIRLLLPVSLLCTNTFISVSGVLQKLFSIFLSFKPHGLRKRILDAKHKYYIIIDSETSSEYLHNIMHTQVVTYSKINSPLYEIDDRHEYFENNQYERIQFQFLVPQIREQRILTLNFITNINITQLIF
ncbi:Hypothetical_protein [Hexamita inflata]|uniref:Hypothetical_protein n=1 Tax=Hexamita inflata TaxID=28002 RepID=A0AA86U8M8_9EUKA|nr:Hypothetical protein HINF_LOCUS35265 [Hexamita inflata]